MYKISEQSNVEGHDRAVKAHTDKFGIFNYKLLGGHEQKVADHHKPKRVNRSTAIDEAIQDIWKSFTVPVKFRIVGRSQDRLTQSAQTNKKRFRNSSTQKR